MSRLKLAHLLIIATLVAVPEAVFPQSRIDPRCAQGISCQLFGCAVGSTNRPAYCRSQGFGDAQNECARMGGTWRPGPGGAPFIWCDFPQAAPQEQPSSSQPNQSPAPQQTPRQSRGDRLAALAAIVELGIQLAQSYKDSAYEAEQLRLAQQWLDRNPEEEARRNKAIQQDALAGLTRDLTLDRNRTSEQILGDLAEARKICGGNPGTRRELSECFRSLSAAYIRQAALCEDSSQDLSTLQRGGAPGIPINPSPSIGQRTFFDACTDIKSRGAKVAHCVAVGILQESNQFNPLFKGCMQKEGLL